MHRSHSMLVATCMILALVSPTAIAATKTTKPRARATTTNRAANTVAPTTTAVATTLASAPATTATATVPPATGSITVFAAASLTASFTDIAAAFEKANPGAKVTLNFAGSSTLVTQITNGAPADVFASADAANMDKLVNAKVIQGAPLIFTKNKLMIVVPKGNRMRLKGLADLASPDVIVVLGAVGVPAGDYARQILAKAGVTVNPKSLESSVSAIVSKAALGEIDAGIVYATDVAIDDYRVDGVAIPAPQNVTATYPIGALASSKNPAAATAFVAFTQTSAAQAILAKYKFLPLK